MENVKADEDRIAWKVAGTVFRIGLTVWIIQLIVVLLLLKVGAGWYPGAIHSSGGEWDGWYGPGWLVEHIWCLGTEEMCNKFPTTRFTFSPGYSLFAVFSWGVISAIIGRVTAKRRMRTQS